MADQAENSPTLSETRGSQALFKMISNEIYARPGLKRVYYYDAEFHAEVDMFFRALIKIDNALVDDPDHEKILNFLIEGWFRHWPKKQ